LSSRETRASGPPGGPAAPAVSELAERVRRIMGENERLFAQLIRGERRYRGLARAVWTVQEEERRRLARELHDGIGQDLTALKNQLELLARRAADTAPHLGSQLAAAVELAATALRDTRELSRLLRPPVLDDLGLGPALAWLARTLGERTGLAVELASELGEERFTPDVETLVFRVVQEALTNVLKHAGAAAARVEVGAVSGRVWARVSDAGAGFDPGALAGEQASGSGLRGIRDRLDLFGGRLEVRSSPGHGTVLEVELPLAEPPAAAGEGAR
jgi:two-component system, NarL family, sensor kinase